MNDLLVKAVSLFVALILAITLTAAAWGAIKWQYFWVMAAISAVYTYWVLPQIRRR